MKNRKVYIIIGVVVIIAVVIFVMKSGGIKTALENMENQNKTSNKAPDATQTTKNTQKGTSKVSATNSSAALNFPEIDFIDKRIAFPLKDFPGLKITVEKVVFGRKSATISPGCSGIPNANFVTYLYPGSNICVSDSKVDGSPRGIVAFHLLVENNGQIGFGGNSNALKLHYLRSDPSGRPVHKFATPLIGLESYYVNQSSSKKIILSYLVPEDQLVYEFIAGYKEPPLENKSLNIYDFSVNGLLVDFGSKDLKVIK